MHKLLSVDDSKAVHSFINDCLKESAYEIHHVYDGKQALEILFEGNKQKFDLILLDWEMPIMQGPEVLKEIRSRGVHTPILMLTSKNDPSDIQKVLELGANEYLMKPFTPDLIQEKIKTTLELAA